MLINHNRLKQLHWRKNGLIEAAGIIISTRLKIEKALTERKAFDHKSATDAKEAKIDIQAVYETIKEAVGKRAWTQKPENTVHY